MAKGCYFPLQLLNYTMKPLGEEREGKGGDEHVSVVGNIHISSTQLKNIPQPQLPVLL